MSSARSVMRRARSFASLSGVVIVGCTFWASGCDTFYRDCVHVEDKDSRKICEAYLLPSGASSSSGTPPGCIPSENSTPVEDGCGVFVSSSVGADGAAGTKKAPLKNLQQAIDAAKGRPVYACAEAFAGSVTLASGSAIFGGLDCTKDWSYIGATTKSALTGDADKVALTIEDSASGAKVEDFTITAANAVAAGGSSIAVVVDGATAEIARCDLIAGDGMAGAAGAHLADDPALDGDSGDPGAAACDPGATHPGPTGKTKTCPSGGMSIAGNGGDGGAISMMMPQPAGSGTDGSPADVDGKGGLGEGQPGAPSSCKSGTDGTSGGAGDSGAGASGIGSVTASGYAGVNGTDGTAGKPGQGGGGGGGAKGALKVMCGASTVDVPGASGGSGGTGGCGGAAGGGGQAGGSSIALVSLKATVTLTSVTLKAGKGGDGGVGGAGQTGGSKGPGGLSGKGTGILNDSCRGGDGGKGGVGGPGGGGQGGHSLGLASTGTAPTIEPAQITIGTFGKGGAGAAGNATANMGKGADGIAAATQSFP